jgi:hypothetical protein
MRSVEIDSSLEKKELCAIRWLPINLIE